MLCVCVAAAAPDYSAPGLRETPQSRVARCTDARQARSVVDSLRMRAGCRHGEAQRRAITVAVADRHALVRRALIDLIGFEPGFSVVAQAGSAEMIAQQLRRTRPRLLLLEPALLGGRGLVGLPRLLLSSPRTSAVVLADEESPVLERHAEGCGAAASVVKHAPPEELFATLRRVVAATPVAALRVVA